MADDTFINSAEYNALNSQLTNLRAQVNQLISELDNIDSLIESKVETLDWQKMNTYFQSKINELKTQISDVNQFGTTAYFLNRANHTGPEIVNANCRFGANVNSTIGFFGDDGNIKQTVTNLTPATAGGSYTANEQTMIQNNHDTLIALINALKEYNLI